MLGANDTQNPKPFVVHFDDITSYVWGDVGGNSSKELEAYVASRIPRENGERLSGKNLTLAFSPSDFEGHDTFIGRQVEVGRDCVIGYHVSVGEGTFLGSNVHIQNDCTIGRHVTIEPGSDIGRENVIPDLVTIGAGTIIPDGLFRSGDVKAGFDINQSFVDRFMEQRADLVR